MPDRTILIGDIHGCQRTLDALLKKIAYTPEEDRIIFVGDYIDRGPHIRETLDHLIRLQEKAGDRAVFLMGNHEKMLLDVADSTWKGQRFFEHPARNTADRKHLTFLIDGCRIWLWNGGTETERQIFSLERAVYDRYLEWLSRNLVYDYRDEEGRFFVTHAGAEYGVEQDSIETKVWNRSGSYDGPLVICGHTPVKKPLLCRNSLRREYPEYGKAYELPLNGMLDIDTACVFGHSLTAMIIIGRQFYFESAANCESGTEEEREREI